MYDGTITSPLYTRDSNDLFVFIDAGRNADCLVNMNDVVRFETYPQELLFDVY